MLSGKQAPNMALSTSSAAVAVGQARTIAGISSANLVERQQRYDLSDFLHIFAAARARL